MKMLRTVLVLALVPAALLVVSGGLPVHAADAFVPPWQAAAPYPSSWDLRNVGWLTPVRSQDNKSTCWIMAATGSLESSTLRIGGRALDYSENNLANHMATKLVYEGYAPSEVAAAYYARWEGPVLESQDPYPHPDPGGSPAYLRAVRHVQDVVFLPQRTGPLDNDAIKWAVTTYGGIDCAAAFEPWRQGFWNEGRAAYYNDRITRPNHHILCVGWDDDFPASYFATAPPGDGAFLIKNSWGSDWGPLKGYAWVSYYDAGFGSAMAVFDGVQGAGNYDAVYQFDALGRSEWLDPGAGGTAWYANRFTCAGSGKVKAISFYTPAPGTTYEVRVAGSLAAVQTAATTASGTLGAPGYHTVRLEQPVAVTKGHVFVAAVRVLTPGWSQPVPVEAPSALIAPRARSGQSFVSTDGSVWSDLTRLGGLASANVCLKAFVDGAGDTRPPRVDLRGGTVPAAGGFAVRWRLEDPGFSSASALIVLTVRDSRGAVVARRRLPAVAVGERGTWAVGAGWAAGRYTVRGHAYDVAGRRQPQATTAAIVVPAGAAAAWRAAAKRH